MNDIAEVLTICKKYGFKNPVKIETDSLNRYYMIDTNDRQHKIYIFQDSILEYIYIDKKICKAEDILTDSTKNLEPVNNTEPIINREPEKQEDNNREPEDIKEPVNNNTEQEDNNREPEKQEDIKKPEDYIL